MPSKRNILRLLILLGIFIALTSALLFYRKSIHYPYNTAQDYRYNFHQSSALSLSGKLHNGHIYLNTPLHHKGMTLFLEMRIETTLPGRYLQPVLTLHANGASVTEYPEQGGSGIRYINISPLLNGKMLREIEITSHHLHLPDQKVRLHLFQNPPLQQAKILILAPHPDDAEIAAYGLYSRYPKSTYIITATAGDSGPNNYDEIVTDPEKAYKLKAKVRIWNSITVPILGGIPPSRCLNLGFFDGTLETMYRQTPQPVAAEHTGVTNPAVYRRENLSPLASQLKGKATWPDLVADMERLLHAIKPDIVILPSPLLDAHPDHRYSAVAMLEAIRNSGMRHGKLLFYTNHFTQSEYYPYGNAGGAVSLPPHFQKPLYFESLYSYNLTPSQQQEKILALDAMNDLRLDTEWHTFRGACKVALKTLLKQDLLGIEYANYYRRAIRQNELFFVVRFETLQNAKRFREITGESR